MGLFLLCLCANTLKIVASAVAPPPPGGELSFLTIEQLISVDDVVKHRNSASGSGAI